MSRSNRLPALAADVIGRPLAMIVVASSAAAFAAKAFKRPAAGTPQNDHRYKVVPLF
jgi:hypothetical protein